MKASELERLVFNPFHISKIFHHFISGATTVHNKGIKTELIYLVLPLILDEKISSKLQRLNKNSKLNVITENKEFEIFMIQLNNKIKQNRIATKNGIIVLANTTTIAIDENISINETINYLSETDIHLKKIYKAAYILGILLAKERYLTVLRKLRITEL